MILNQSQWSHFAGAFTFGIIVKRFIPNKWIAFAIVMAGGIAIEIYQYFKWVRAYYRGHTMLSVKYYWLDTTFDIIADACGAVLAIFVDW